MGKDDFRGYRQAFDKAGKVVREITTFSNCPECGIPMEVKRTWRNQPGGKGTAYHIEGLCPKGHKVERYGFGEPVDDTPPAQVLTNPKSVQTLRRSK